MMKLSVKIILYFIILPCIAHAQIELLPIDSDANIILNDSSLNKVFALLGKNNESVISFFHVGDSHIQADHFTGEIRKHMQATYGNAGRGLVFPYQAARTNGPVDYTFRSPQHHTCMKLVKPASNMFCGVAGYALMPDPKKVFSNFDYTSKPDSGETGSTVKSISLIYETAGNTPQISIVSTFNNSPATFITHNNFQAIHNDSFVFSEPISQFSINMQLMDHAPLSVDALILTNGNNGLLYHSAGVNGAKFAQFIHAPKFMQELAMLKPSLVIISLGTNESAGRYDSLEFISTVDSLVRSVEALGSTVLITTPANNYLSHKSYKYVVKKGRKRRVKTRVYVHNETVKAIRNNLVAYCNARQLPCWDLYSVMGGDYSMKQWVEAGKGAKDHLHFSKGGYKFQGELFYNAFSAAYLKYLSK